MESSVENKNEVQCSKSRSPSPDTKSKARAENTIYAIVKEYSQLECYTDLTMPPTDWNADLYGLKMVLAISPFSIPGVPSWRMDHVHPDARVHVTLPDGRMYPSRPSPNIKRPYAHASCRYMLSNSHIPLSTDPAEPDFGGFEVGLMETECCCGNRDMRYGLRKGMKMNLLESCSRSIMQAYEGLLALHHAEINGCKKADRERIKFKLSQECFPDIDEDDINIYPIWQEPHREDDFAWKLHLKTLLYEKICLGYATFAEYHYANSQYGLSLQYFERARKCRKLLCNMTIKSKVVDASWLIGRVADNYFQISKNWTSLERYKEQFQREYDIDEAIDLDIENDLVEEVDDGDLIDDFDHDISFPTDQISTMLRSIELYTRVLQVAEKRRSELLRRRASVLNQLALRYMDDAQEIYQQFDAESDHNDPKAKQFLEQFQVMSQKSLDCLDEAADIFKQVYDIPNHAIVLSNKGRYWAFKACNTVLRSEKRKFYFEAAKIYNSAVTLLEPERQETCRATAVYDTVCYEEFNHVYNRHIFLQDQVEELGAADDGSGPQAPLVAEREPDDAAGGCPHDSPGPDGTGCSVGDTACSVTKPQT